MRFLFARVGVFRTYAYLGLSGAIWLAEGFLFAHYLRFSPGQVVAVAVVYAALYGLALRALLKSLRGSPTESQDSAAWRVVAVAPMVTFILGSFASLPLIVAIAVLGKLL